MIWFKGSGNFKDRLPAFTVDIAWERKGSAEILAVRNYQWIIMTSPWRHIDIFASFSGLLSLIIYQTFQERLVGEIIFWNRSWLSKSCFEEWHEQRFEAVRDPGVPMANGAPAMAAAKAKQGASESWGWWGWADKDLSWIWDFREPLRKIRTRMYWHVLKYDTV